nr:glycosyltransferase [uncultured Carboxylicivirga sp.]
MRIQFISNYGQLYGANRSLLTLVNYFKHRGYEVKVLLPKKGGMSQELDKLNIDFDIIPYFSAFLYVKLRLKYLVLPMFWIMNVFSFPIIYRNIKEFNPDLIYSNTAAENIGILFAKLLKIKHISHIREFMSKDHRAYFLLGKNYKQKYLLQSDGVIFVSNSVKRDLLNDSVKYEKKTKVIYNGMAIPEKNKYYSRLQNNIIRLGVFGIFDPSKGQDVALKYFSELCNKHSSIELHFYGDKEGLYKKKLFKYVKRNKNITKRVYFHGFIKEVSLAYDEVDIVLVFSKSEGFGRVAVESMLHKVPVIGFDNGGTSEIIEDRITGCLFNDYFTFEESFNYLTKNSSNYTSLINNAYKSAVKKFGEDVYVKNIEKFIIELFSEYK